MFKYFLAKGVPFTMKDVFPAPPFGRKIKPTNAAK